MALCEWCKKLHSCPERTGGYMMNNGCKSYIPLFNSIFKEENKMEAQAEEEYYSNRLLARQQEIMTDYLKVLELRATLAGIELS